MGILQELFSEAVDDGEVMTDLAIEVPESGFGNPAPADPGSQQIEPAAPPIQKSMASVRDGDGDGFIFDGTPKEMKVPYTPEIQSYVSPLRKDGTPNRPNVVDVYTVPTESLAVDPKRFQYKFVGIDQKTGVTAELKEARAWNPMLGGVLLVWRDPESGQDYVVNGHHRLDLAMRTKTEVVNVRYIKADNEAGARSSGALANIAEGRGTAIDAAKFLRDADATVDDLARAGVSLKGKIASDAVTLTRLSDKAFEGVSTGTLDETKAIAVAKFLTDHSLQDKLLKRMADREEDGKDWTIKEIETASRKMANAGVLKTQGVDLFGEFESEESTFDQEVEIESFIRRQLAQEVSDFSAVASQRRADRVASAGNVLQVDQNELRAKSAEILLNSFDRESGLRGEVADTIKTYAAELAGVASKSKKSDVKTRSFEAIREMLLKGESRV